MRSVKKYITPIDMEIIYRAYRSVCQRTTDLIEVARARSMKAAPAWSPSQPGLTISRRA